MQTHTFFQAASLSVAGEGIPSVPAAVEHPVMARPAARVAATRAARSDLFTLINSIPRSDKIQTLEAHGLV